MKKYRVIEKPLYLSGGVLELTGTQASSRKHCLKPAGGKKGRHEIVQQVCFKVGEVIGMEAEAEQLLKTGLIEPEDKEAAKAEEEAKAKAELEAKVKAEEEAKAKAEEEAKAKAEAESKKNNDA